MKVESLLQYVDEYLGVAAHPDYRTALNGLQVEGPETVERIATAVDASVASIEAAAELDAQLLMVHHGIFWGGLQPITGAFHKRVSLLIEHGIALYSCHLPLDGHPEIGNCALLARALGLELDGRLGQYEGVDLGWTGSFEDQLEIETLTERVSAAVGGSAVKVLPGGPPEIGRVGVVTGGASSFIREAADAGLDAFITGEGPHHAYFEAVEFGIHVLFAGHYATETFGVRALGRHLTERFGVESSFIDQPTGL
ncbi:MAG: Nif3-like dinuclear metal center hexameric protein [Gemmatimonadota bacterium]|nr:Nif3-like dinuclear metal center hexameric protein [Gemmatimonadota bacterium]